jgi:hypothetical protein
MSYVLGRVYIHYAACFAGAMTLGITTFSIITLSTFGLFATPSIIDTQHK